MEDTLTMDTPESLLGQVLSRSYRLETLIAEGGASLVFEAERMRPPRRKVALKLLHPALQNDREMSALFQHEAEVLGQLRHEHAVELLDMGHTDEDLPFVVLELLRGETLRQRLERDGPLPVPEVGQLVQQAAAALEALHELSVVHRDVRPGNLFLAGQPDAELHVKLMDFALALSFSPRPPQGQSEVVGSEGYMSPEQFRGELHETDGATDQFALAVVAYEALCGRRPFDAGEADELLRQVNSGTFTPVTARARGLPPQVNQALARALDPDKQKRHDSVTAFAGELCQVLRRQPVTAPQKIVEPPPRPAATGARVPGLPPAPQPEQAAAGQTPLAVAAPAAPRLPSPMALEPEPALPEPQVDDLEDQLIGGLTLMDSPSPVAELVEEDTSLTPPPVLAALDAEDTSVARPPAREGAPAAPPAAPAALDGQTIMLDDGLADELASGEAPGAGRGAAGVEQEAALAGHTLLGDDDFLDQLAESTPPPVDRPAVDPDSQKPLQALPRSRPGAPAKPSPPAPAPPAPSPAANAKPAPPGARSSGDKSPEIVTVFQGDAWARAEAMARGDLPTTPEATGEASSRPPTAQQPVQQRTTLKLPQVSNKTMPLAVAAGVGVALLVLVLLYVFVFS